MDLQTARFNATFRTRSNRQGEAWQRVLQGATGILLAGSEKQLPLNSNLNVEMTYHAVDAACLPSAADLRYFSTFSNRGCLHRYNPPCDTLIDHDIVLLTFPEVFA